jgi:hypothetical protein
MPDRPFQSPRTGHQRHAGRSCHPQFWRRAARNAQAQLQLWEPPCKHNSDSNGIERQQPMCHTLALLIDLPSRWCSAKHASDDASEQSKHGMIRTSVTYELTRKCFSHCTVAEQSKTAHCPDLHMYWMASWSPSQSLPLMVSYACHLQSSTVMLPRAALMPPWAATVCERVGKSLVMQLHQQQQQKIQ